MVRYVREKATGLVVLADGSDNPGGGGPSDGTVILEALIEEEIEGAVIGILATRKPLIKPITQALAKRLRQ